MDILPDSIIWMSPGDKGSTEYYYILEGKLLLILDDGEQTLSKGDSFSVSGIDSEFPDKCLER